MARRRLQSRGETTDRLASLGKLASKVEGWRPAAEILTKVRAKPTIFPQIDRATRIGGWPLERISLVHGPSNHGKTLLVHGIGLSFLRDAGMYALIDAERTTSHTWLTELMGEHAESPGFVALRPDSYESAVKAVRSLIEQVIEQKEKRQLDENFVGFLAVDSIRKLVPERILEKIIGEAGGIDGMKGRTAMYKAALNAAWLDELVPLIHRAKFGMAIITRESENTEARGPYDKNYKVQGGKAIEYESSLTCRVTRASWLYKGSGDSKEVIGERHSVLITKTKVGAKDGKDSIAYFHTSNGAVSTMGFDRARDVLDIATRLGIIEQSGAWYSFEGERLGSGEVAASKMLREHPEICEEIAARCALGEGELLSQSEEVPDAAR